MTDAVTNAEIEDVLTSIRRLVSENHPSLREETKDGEAEGPLVLTPALRVVEKREGQGPEADALDDAAPEDVRAAQDRESEPQDVAEPAPETAHEKAPEDELHRPETGEGALPAGEPEAENGAAREAVSHEEAAPEDALAEPDGFEPDVPEMGSDLEKRIAELEAAVSASHDEWEPDGSEIEIEASEAFVLRAVGGRAHHGNAGPEIIDAEPVTEELNAAETPDMEPLEADAEETGSPEHEDEHGAGDDLQDMPTVELLDAERDDEDYAYIDEEALRDLVLRLIREELQGQMGERITYNVRRMVRREVQKALTIRDLD